MLNSFLKKVQKQFNRRQTAFLTNGDGAWQNNDPQSKTQTLYKI